MNIFKILKTYLLISSFYTSIEFILHETGIWSSIFRQATYPNMIAMYIGKYTGFYYLVFLNYPYTLFSDLVYNSFLHDFWSFWLIFISSCFVFCFSSYNYLNKIYDYTKKLDESTRVFPK